MSVFTYTARDELAPGTSDLELVTRDFRIVTFPRTRKPVGRRNTSLSGAVESMLFRSEKTYRCQTGLLDPLGLLKLQVLEFLASVENSQPFTFDRYGTVATPDNPVSCLMVSTSLAEVEVGRTFHRHGFVIRES